jgi:hypothetical protein
MVHRLRKAWRVTIRGYDNADVFYAPSAGKARVQAWRSVDDASIRIVDVVASRLQERDVFLPVRSPVADQLSESERHCLLHAFGGNGDPMRAGYRDHFYTQRDDPRLVALTERGLMEPIFGDKFEKNMTYFVLTERGKRVALSMVPEYAE